MSESPSSSKLPVDSYVDKAVLLFACGIGAATLSSLSSMRMADLQTVAVAAARETAITSFNNMPAPKTIGEWQQQTMDNGLPIQRCIQEQAIREKGEIHINQDGIKIIPAESMSLKVSELKQCYVTAAEKHAAKNYTDRVPLEVFYGLTFALGTSLCFASAVKGVQAGRNSFLNWRAEGKVPALQGPTAQSPA